MGARLQGAFRAHGAALACVLLAALLAACSPGGPGGQGGGEAQDRAVPLEDLRAVKPRAEQFGAPATGETRAFYEGEFEAVGAEPDWKLTLLQDVATFARVGLEEVVAFPTSREIRQQGALIEAEPLTIILRAGACEHTSGEILPYLATVQYEDVAYEGCARRATEGATPSWSALLPELVPAIDTCLARVESKPARVTIAYLIGDGTVAVRLRDADGGRYECAASLDGSTVSAFEPMSDRNVIDGEGDPAFFRAPTPAPANCVGETAVGADGSPIGIIARGC